MTADEARRPQPVGDLVSARQRTIDILCQQFAEDRIAVGEFERRVDLANQAASAEDLRKLLADLVPAQVPATLPADKTRVAPQVGEALSHPRRTWGFMVGIFGGTVRKGRWVPAESTLAVGVMGGSELDFREARLPPGVTDVTAIAVMGGVEVIVPPGVRVETGAFAFMGGIEDNSEDPDYDDPSTPVIRIKGFACMGGIEITTRLPGETARDAKRRRKALRKRLKSRMIGEGS